MVGVTGARGFLGRKLLADLEAGGHRVRGVSRRDGKLHDPAAAARLLEGARVVVHLAYGPDAPNLEIARTVAKTCVEQRVEHLIHCSTAVVAGAARSDVVTESTPCLPRSEYARAKYQIEREILGIAGDRLAVTIVRPTVVFGPGGVALRKLVLTLSRSVLPLDLLRSFVLGHRRMNLVPIEDVVGAIVQLIEAPPRPRTLLISADDDPGNEYRTVERWIASALGRHSYRGSPVAAPPIVMRTLQRMRRGEDVYPRRRFLSEDLDWRRATRRTELRAAVERFTRSVVEAEG